MIITCQHNTYHRTASGKSWQAKPHRTEWQLMRYSIYMSNFQKPDGFMRALGGTERIYRGYTPAGYTARRVVCVSPDRQKKSERIFRLYYNADDLRVNASPAEIELWAKKGGDYEY